MICPSTETLSDLLDNALPLKKRWQVRWHVRHCSACTRHLAAEVSLKVHARILAADAAAPARLRVSVFNAVTSSSACRRHSPALLAAVLCSVLAVLTAWLLRPVVVPLPAFAEVIEAMQRIRTARWQVESWEYDVRTRKTHRSSWTKFARLDPPALTTMFSKSHRTVLTPDLIKVEQKQGFRVYSAPDFFSVTQDPAATPSSALRKHIRHQIVASHEKGKGNVTWQSRREKVDGRSLLRFDLQIRSRVPRKGTTITSSSPNRLTFPGYRYTIWADPGSLRIARTEAEYYDGQKHTRTISSNYEYDLTVPSDIPGVFRESVRVGRLSPGAARSLRGSAPQVEMMDTFVNRVEAARTKINKMKIPEAEKRRLIKIEMKAASQKWKQKLSAAKH